jgi:hypothetical protein
MGLGVRGKRAVQTRRVMRPCLRPFGGRPRRHGSTQEIAPDTRAPVDDVVRGRIDALLRLLPRLFNFEPIRILMSWHTSTDANCCCNGSRATERHRKAPCTSDNRHPRRCRQGPILAMAALAAMLRNVRLPLQNGHSGVSSATSAYDPLQTLVPCNAMQSVRGGHRD